MRLQPREVRLKKLEQLQARWRGCVAFRAGQSPLPRYSKHAESLEAAQDEADVQALLKRQLNLLGRA